MPGSLRAGSLPRSIANLLPVNALDVKDRGTDFAEHNKNQGIINNISVAESWRLGKTRGRSDAYVALLMWEPVGLSNGCSSMQPRRLQKAFCSGSLRHVSRPTRSTNLVRLGEVGQLVPSISVRGAV